MQRIFQRLSVYLKGGQTVTIDFNAQKKDMLNAQIEDFLKKLGDASAQRKNYLFQGARVVMVRLDEVAACDVVVFTAKGKGRNTEPIAGCPSENEGKTVQ